MPRITAPTVAEHRAQVQTRLVDAAEVILRTGSEELTAGAVSTRAGIARNSIYRYVDSVDDLRGLVVERYLPAWQEAVTRAMDAAPSPRERIVVWVVANLTQAAVTGHAWLMAAARTRPTDSVLGTAANRAHTGMRDSLIEAWSELLGAGADQVAVAVGLTSGILNAGFRELDTDHPTDLVISMSETATRGLVDVLAP